MINLIDDTVFIPLISVVFCIGFLYLLKCIDAYPFRPDNIKDEPQQEDLVESKPIEHIDNTHLIILKCRALNRGKPWPKVKNPTWVQRKRDYDKKQLQDINKKCILSTDNVIGYKVNDYSETVDEFKEELYEVEPYTGKKKPITKKSLVSRCAPILESYIGSSPWF